ncbi:DNA polymerase III subunit delta' [Actinoplanes lobatus]|uniref:DNA polymerase III subunit delta n=1 Tax=Actinoplanes lobatus TaxID=113568 RepID=A0A7W7HCW1_9ACTN|nr:DNA polymerase III subunit delta' [Actinoplanes lobatus]MBB4748213.1 DNA polymerase-3 subunit delta' [Actinoplanes lobatus]GGN70211.1 DNA polymerase III subunit delta' [Actinoplanes lobatus]GIE40062.1 DNA polymerase III subunit delta' [Actinoplanes lobatus]
MSPHDVFSELVGQDEPVVTLRRAATAAARIVAGEPDSGGMTHAWIFTGPPGARRTVAARAFAAALQCERDGTGCGECHGCHTALGGTHADVQVVTTEGLTIKTEETRAVVLRAASAPTGGRWQVVIIEAADRLHERASNALLKAIEEPSPRTVFLLCTPSVHPDDILVTIRSRCRLVSLRQPPAAAVADVLVHRHDIAPDQAAWAAAASQGDVDRARQLAADTEARERRDDVLSVPRKLTSIGACFDAAARLEAASKQEAAIAVAELDVAERAALERALGAGGTGRGATTAMRGAAGQLKELERNQKLRATRAQRDALDRALQDLIGFYRDVLVTSMRAPVPVVHGDLAAVSAAAAGKWTPESTLRRLEAVLTCRDAIDRNVKPQVALEAMMVSLWQG